MPTKRDSRAPVRQANLTRHELAIRLLIQSHPEMHRNRFRKAVEDLWLELNPMPTPDGPDWDEDDPWTLEQWITDCPGVDFKPDAYRLDRENSEILIYEVEDSHPIPVKKLWKLAMFWFYWDCEGEHDWLPRAIIVDRYGNQKAEIDLQSLYHELLSEQALR